MSVGDLQKAHPDFPWKTLQIKSNEYFGMIFSKYLAKEGILIAEKATSLSVKNGENGVAELIEVLKQRYEGKPKPADLKTLIAENPDLPLTSLNSAVRTLFGTTAGAYDSPTYQKIKKALAGDAHYKKSHKNEVHIAAVITALYVDEWDRCSTMISGEMSMVYSLCCRIVSASRMR